MAIYETKITAIGPEAELFKAESMIILFGNEAPDMLKDMCYNIEVNPVQGDISVGQNLFVDEEAFAITAVGSVVRQNLASLGHIVVKFNGATEAELPGTLHVDAGAVPDIKVGTKLRID